MKLICEVKISIEVRDDDPQLCGGFCPFLRTNGFLFPIEEVTGAFRCSCFPSTSGIDRGWPRQLDTEADSAGRTQVHRCPSCKDKFR